MAIITQTQTPAQDFLDRCAAREINGVQALKQLYVSGFNDLWKNKNLTPAQTATALGTNGAKYFQAASAMVSLIQISEPTWTAPAIPQNPASTATPKAPYSVTVNNDGTITVA